MQTTDAWQKGKRQESRFSGTSVSIALSCGDPLVLGLAREDVHSQVLAMIWLFGAKLGSSKHAPQSSLRIPVPRSFLNVNLFHFTQASIALTCGMYASSARVYIIHVSVGRDTHYYIKTRLIGMYIDRTYCSPPKPIM